MHDFVYMLPGRESRETRPGRAAGGHGLRPGQPAPDADRTNHSRVPVGPGRAAPRLTAAVVTLAATAAGLVGYAPAHLDHARNRRRGWSRSWRWWSRPAWRRASGPPRRCGWTRRRAWRSPGCPGGTRRRAARRRRATALPPAAARLDRARRHRRHGGTRPVRDVRRRHPAAVPPAGPAPGSRHGHPGPGGGEPVAGAVRHRGPPVCPGGAGGAARGPHAGGGAAPPRAAAGARARPGHRAAAAHPPLGALPVRGGRRRAAVAGGTAAPGTSYRRPAADPRRGGPWPGSPPARCRSSPGFRRSCTRCGTPAHPGPAGAALR